MERWLVTLLDGSNIEVQGDMNIIVHGSGALFFVVENRVVDCFAPGQWLRWMQVPINAEQN